MGHEAIHLLLIGDDPLSVEELSFLLDSSNEEAFCMTVAPRLAEGLDRLVGEGMDLVLLDLNLPDYDGLEAVTKIRQSAPRIPIVVLTSPAAQAIASQTLGGAACGFLVKGRINWHALARAILCASNPAMAEEHRRRLALLLDNTPDRALSGISHDITELKRAELAVRDSEERYNRLLDSVADYVYTVEMDSGTVLSTNHGHGCIAVTGYAADEFRSDSTLWYRVIHPDDRQSVMSSVQEIVETGSPVSIEHRIIRKDGSIRWVRNKQAPRHDEAGRLTAYDGLISDISERKHAEDLLRAANAKLREVLGDLTKSHEELKATQLELIQMERHQLASEIAAGVAHEVKNPLAILQMGIQFFAEQPTIERETADAVLHEMREAVERANSVIEDLLIFSSAREFAMHEASITSLLEEILRLTRPGLAMGGIKMVVNLDPHLPACRMDPGKIEQVFANVISNASQAMPSGGTLTITAIRKTLGSGDVNFEQGDRSGRRLRQGDSAVVIEISDTGTGIPADKLSRVFDPFFTTKKTGKGKGLGLSVSKKIIDLHDGEISIANVHGGGSRVTIVLPYAPARDDA